MDNHIRNSIQYKKDLHSSTRQLRNKNHLGNANYNDRECLALAAAASD